MIGGLPSQEMTRRESNIVRDLEGASADIEPAGQSEPADEQQASSP